ncbi:MAG: phosphatidate cytidylyltransferase [Clostridia bacterium]|nr:phosphatidate cytidylyltransferase [Clostridia bacterium]
MKVRIAVGIALALFAIGMLVCTGYGYEEVMTIPVVLLSVICVHEILGISGCKNKVMTRLMMLFSAGLDVFICLQLGRYLPFSPLILVGIYVLAVLILMLKMYDITRFEHVASGLVASIAVSLSLSSVVMTVHLLEKYPVLFSRSNIVYILLMPMFCAWLCDTFALFIGRAFGKHKMAPKISPKKSVEGAIAGIVGTTISGMIAIFVCDHFFFLTDTIRWWMVLIYMPVGCIMGMCGDLAASVIKRNYGVKDFGTLFPEHGGAMDRVDSFLFTMPSMYILLNLVLSIFVK